MARWTSGQSTSYRRRCLSSGDMDALGQGIRKTRLSACVVGEVEVVVDGMEWAAVAPSTGQLRTGLTHLDPGKGDPASRIDR